MIPEPCSLLVGGQTDLKEVCSPLILFQDELAPYIVKWTHSILRDPTFKSERGVVEDAAHLRSDLLDRGVVEGTAYDEGHRSAPTQRSGTAHSLDHVRFGPLVDVRIVDEEANKTAAFQFPVHHLADWAAKPGALSGATCSTKVGGATVFYCVEPCVVFIAASIPF